MKKLIERLEDAEHGSRELDAELGVAIVGYKLFDVDSLLHYTASIDDALTLVPQGWVWSLEVNEDGNAEGCIAESLDSFTQHSTCASTPALTICIAALKAKEIEYD